MTTRDTSGFTLLEVLIAFVIAALALGVMFRVAAEALNATRTAARYDEALVRARSHLTMATHGGALMPGDWQGGDGGGYRWHLHVAPASLTSVPPAGAPAPPIALYAVTVWVTWTEGEHIRQVRLDTEAIGQPAGR